MDQKEVLKFIELQGYRTLKEIHAHFEKEDQEILDAILIALTERHGVRKLAYESIDGKSYLFCILPK